MHVPGMIQAWFEVPLALAKDILSCSGMHGAAIQMAGFHAEQPIKSAILPLPDAMGFKEARDYILKEIGTAELGIVPIRKTGPDSLFALMKPDCWRSRRRSMQEPARLSFSRSGSNTSWMGCPGALMPSSSSKKSTTRSNGMHVSSSRSSQKRDTL